MASVKCEPGLVVPGQPTMAGFMGNSVEEPQPPKPKRGRKKKVKEEIKQEPGEAGKRQTTIPETMKVKKKRDRFHGMTEEEVLKRVLPDHLAHDLDIIIIGINPGLTAAYVGHHYAGPGNHFWKCLFLSGLIPEQMNAYDDHKLLQYGIGFTNIVERTSRGSADLTKKEIQEGGEILKGKIQKYKPKIAVFNGKGIYEVFVGHKKFHIGKQPEPFPDTDTHIFVMPSSSARFTQLPRAIDKVPFYVALKKFRDHLRGNVKEIDETEIVFPYIDLKVKPRVKTEPQEGEAVEKKPEKKPRSASKSRGRPKKMKGAEVVTNPFDDAQGQVQQSPYFANPNNQMSFMPTGIVPPNMVGPVVSTQNVGATSMSQFQIKQEPGTMPYGQNPNSLCHVPANNGVSSQGISAQSWLDGLNVNHHHSNSQPFINSTQNAQSQNTLQSQAEYNITQSQGMPQSGMNRSEPQFTNMTPVTNFSQMQFTQGYTQATPIHNSSGMFSQAGGNSGSGGILPSSFPPTTQQNFSLGSFAQFNGTQQNNVQPQSNMTMLQPFGIKMEKNDTEMYGNTGH